MAPRRDELVGYRVEVSDCMRRTHPGSADPQNLFLERLELADFGGGDDGVHSLELLMAGCLCALPGLLFLELYGAVSSFHTLASSGAAGELRLDVVAVVGARRGIEAWDVFL
jgi:hypothetical protein